MNTPTPSISVIICSRDRPGDLLGCLGSLVDQVAYAVQVIVVSGSDESVPTDLGDRFSGYDLEIIECYEHNISKSRNAGLTAATGEIVLFIDDDARARSGWISGYIDCFDSNPNAWAIGGDVFDSRTSPPLSEFASGVVSTLGRQISVREGLSPCPRGHLSTVKGCNFAIRREEICGIGGFDPFFAFAFDEADLMLSIHRAGGQVVHSSVPIVDHAHTPGHYRKDRAMDRDWRVEYASHTMFMLKHASRSERGIGWLIIRRRFAKLWCTAGLCVIRREIGIVRWAKVLSEANAGISEARQAYIKSRSDR